MLKQRGRILKGIGGFYYVETEKALIECKARGAFRKDNLTLQVGDFVEIEYDESTNKGVIDEIFDRKNSLIRPPISNIDKLYIVTSTYLPEPNTLNIDKLTALCVYKNIEPILVVSKTDVKKADELIENYKKAGITVFETNKFDKSAAEKIGQSLNGYTCAFAGNSGVGKSTLINMIEPNLKLQTGEVSLKLSRGRHTTRHVELFKINGGYIADTPGFSSLDFESGVNILKDELIYCFPDLLKYADNCRFKDCAHINEKDCSLKEAVLNGDVVESRYLSYKELYKEAEKIKVWDIKGQK